VSGGDRILQNINYIQIDGIEGVYLAQGPPYNNVTLHLIATHPLNVPEPLRVLTWDGFGISQILDIDLNGTAKNVNKTAVEAATPPMEKDEGNKWYLTGAIIVPLR